MRDYPQYQCSALPTELTSPAQVTFITAKISFLFASLSAFQIYDFHIFTVVESKHCLPLQNIQYAKYNLTQERKEAQNASLIDNSSLKEKI